MVLRRKRSRKPMKRKRSLKRRRVMRTRIPRNLLTGNLMHVKLRTENPLVVSNDNVIAVKGSYQFKLTDCLNSTRYTQMFDQYRLNKVVIKWRVLRVTNITAENTTVLAPLGGFTNIPNFVSVVDFDDTLVVDYDDVRERYGSRVRPATRPGTDIITPKVLSEAYRSTTSSAYIPKAKQWLDSTYNDVPHFGLKWAMQPSEPAGQYAIEGTVTYYVSFKNRMI